MSNEFQKTYSQLILPNFSVSSGKILESNWTEFARTHNVKISIHSIIHRNPRGTKLGGKTYFTNSNNMFLKENIWNSFIEKNKTYKLTIQEYKKLDKHKSRPFWAKTFSERKMSDEGKYKIIDHRQFGYYRFHSVEQEFVDPKEPEAQVFRYKDMGGNCRRITVVYPGENGNFNVRQEDWISKGTWTVTSDTQLSKEEVCELNLSC